MTGSNGEHPGEVESPPRFTVPASIDALRSELDDLAAIVTAREWQRAATVYAWTTCDDKGGPRPINLPKTRQVSCSEFARFGIAGLRSRETVSRYRRTWQTAIDKGAAKEAVPGQPVTLPDLAWADAYDSTAGKSRYDKLTGVSRSRVRPRQHTIKGKSPALRFKSRKVPEATIDPVPTHRKSTTVALIVATVGHLRHDNAENRFAFDVADARRLGDDPWLAAARTALDDVTAYVSRLYGVLDDETKRDRAMSDPSRRDDVGHLFLVAADRDETGSES